MDNAYHRVHQSRDSICQRILSRPVRLTDLTNELYGFLHVLSLKDEIPYPNPKQTFLWFVDSFRYFALQHNLNRPIVIGHPELQLLDTPGTRVGISSSRTNTDILLSPRSSHDICRHSAIDMSQEDRFKAGLHSDIITPCNHGNSAFGNGRVFLPLSAPPGCISCLVRTGPHCSSPASKVAEQLQTCYLWELRISRSGGRVYWRDTGGTRDGTDR